MPVFQQGSWTQEQLLMRLRIAYFVLATEEEQWKWNLAANQIQFLENLLFPERKNHA